MSSPPTHGIGQVRDMLRVGGAEGRDGRGDGGGSLELSPTVTAALAALAG